MHAGESGFSLHFCKNAGWRNVTWKSDASNVSCVHVCGLAGYLDVWRWRPRNTVAIVSPFPFSVLIKELEPVPTDMLTQMFDSFLLFFNPHFYLKVFLQSVYICVLILFFNLTPTPLLLYARSVQPLTTVAMAAQAYSTENVNANYNILWNIQ